MDTVFVTAVDQESSRNVVLNAAPAAPAAPTTSTTTEPSTTTSTSTIPPSSTIFNSTTVPRRTTTTTSSTTTTSTVPPTTTTTTTVALSSRTISIDSASFTTTYNRYATAPTITSTASSGAGAKNYSTTTSSVCSINNTSGLVTLITAGTCSIAMYIASDSTYDKVSATSISFATTYTIGDTGPAGGKIFILPSTDGNSTGKYFESALGTWSSGAEGQAKWCNQSPGDWSHLFGSAANATAIGSGLTNSTAIAAYCATGASDDAIAYRGGDLSDWYLPSIGELRAMYAQKAAIGGFLDAPYWSSSESTSSTPYNMLAEILIFTSGSQGDSWMKYLDRKVRPIRMFSPIT